MLNFKLYYQRLH